MEKIELSIAALANSEPQSSNFVVILKEERGNRRLPVVIGGFEAQAIAIAIENIRPSRPLTHDLFKSTLDALGVMLDEIVISDLKNGIFYATLVCRQPDGTRLEMDSRTSDAIAMAVRFRCPIYAYDFIMDEAGVALEESGESREPAPKKEPSSLHSQSVEKLKEMLNDALDREDYERAAEIRDELQRREEN